EDIPGLWRAETTTMADRQKIVRLLVERVTVDVEGDSEQVGVVIEWMGGQASQHSLVRPVQRYEQLSGYGRLMQRIRELREEGRTLAEVAERLNSEGFRPPKRRATDNTAMVGRQGRRGGRKATSAGVGSG